MRLRGMLPHHHNISQQRVGDYLQDDAYRRAAESRTLGSNVPRGDGQPGDDPPGDDPPGDGPPGLPSIRSSPRDTNADDLTSVTAATAIETPRVSRREADKVFVSPWLKHQNLGIWTSDLIKGVCLAANDGDRAAWEAWLQPAVQQDPDLDALNDSDGQRFQSIPSYPLLYPM
eukprot:s172_g32.t1